MLHYTNSNTTTTTTTNDFNIHTNTNTMLGASTAALDNARPGPHTPPRCEAQRAKYLRSSTRTELPQTMNSERGGGVAITVIMRSFLEQRILSEAEGLLLVATIKPPGPGAYELPVRLKAWNNKNTNKTLAHSGQGHKFGGRSAKGTPETMHEGHTPNLPTNIAPY